MHSYFLTAYLTNEGSGMLRIHCQDVYGSSIILYVGNKLRWRCSYHLAYLYTAMLYKSASHSTRGVWTWNIELISSPRHAGLAGWLDLLLHDTSPHSSKETWKDAICIVTFSNSATTLYNRTVYAPFTRKTAHVTSELDLAHKKCAWLCYSQTSWCT